MRHVGTHQRTGNQACLDGALQVANWSVAHCYNTEARRYLAPGPYFWTGTVSNAGCINYYPVPEDVQT